ncbi:MAG: hypothetical protein AABY55_03440, partial [Candidatus Omnitrophota bacterium]
AETFLRCLRLQAGSADERPFDKLRVLRVPSEAEGRESARSEVRHAGADERPSTSLRMVQGGELAEPSFRKPARDGYYDIYYLSIQIIH